VLATPANTFQQKFNKIAGIIKGVDLSPRLFHEYDHHERNPMAYEPYDELKSRLKLAGIGMRELAQALKEPPGTVGNRLNGYIPLTTDKMRVILSLLKAAEAARTDEVAAREAT
jgi:hypothetical protein